MMMKSRQVVTLALLLIVALVVATATPSFLQDDAPSSSQQDALIEQLFQKLKVCANTTMSCIVYSNPCMHFFV